MDIQKIQQKNSTDTYLKKEKKKRNSLEDRIAALESSEGEAVTIPLIILKDIKAAGTDGGTFTSGAWQTRTLNTEEVDTDNLCTLAANQFTLAAGTYDLEASAPANEVARHQTRLRDITNSTTIAAGTSARAAPGGSGHTRSFIVCRFTIAASTTFEIQHQCSSTKATDGFGLAANFGESEVFTVVKITKKP